MIVTWLLLGMLEFEETIDLTEDGGTWTTRTCTGIAVAEYGSIPQGTDCS